MVTTPLFTALIFHKSAVQAEIHNFNLTKLMLTGNQCYGHAIDLVNMERV